MIDPNTQEELIQVEPAIDDAQAMADSQAMAEMPQEDVSIDAGAEEAGIVSSIVKPIAKMIGVETATDATSQVSKEAPKQVKPSGITAWANRHILQTAPQKVEKKIGDMVKTVVNTSNARGMKPTTKLKNFEKNIIEGKYNGDISKLSANEKSIYEGLQNAVKKVDLTPDIATTIDNLINVTPEQSASRLFDKMEQGRSVVFNEFNLEKEVAGILESDIDRYTDDVSHQINFATLTDERDINSIIAYMAEQNKTHIDFERRGIVADDQLYKMADELNADPKFIEDVLAREAGGAIPPAEYIVAMRQVINQSATRLKILAQEVKDTMSPKSKLELAQQFEFHNNFFAKFKGVSAEYGRGLRAMGVAADKTNDEILSVLGAMEKKMNIDDLAQRLIDAEGIKGVNLVTKTWKDNAKMATDYMYGAFMGSMLSSPNTQVQNIFGTMANMASNAIERTVAPFMPGGKDAQDHVKMDEFMAYYYGMKSASGDALKAMWKTIRTGDPYDGLGAFGEEYANKMPSESFNQNNIVGMALDSFYKFSTFMTRNIMGGTDALFKVLNERGELSALSYREARAMVDRGEISPDQFHETLSSMMNNPSKYMLKAASDYSKYIAFQEEPGYLTKTSSEFIQKMPMGRWLVPFARVTGNIMRQSVVERNPVLAPLYGKFRDDMIAGGARRQIALAKLGTGIGLFAEAMNLAESDRITGPYPQDPQEQKMWKELNIKPYSFAVKDDEGKTTYYPYQGLEPFTWFFGAAASYRQLEKRLQFTINPGDFEKRTERMVTGALFALSETVTNKTYMQGLRNLLDATTGQSAAGFEKMLYNFTNTLIPYAGARRALSKDMDEIKRKTDTMSDFIQSQMPGFSDTLPAIYDGFGKEVTHEDPYFRLAPAEEKQDAVYNELKRLFDNTRQFALTDFKEVLGGQKISPEDSEKWLLHARRDYRDYMGRTLYRQVSDIIKSPEYKNKQLLDDERVKMIKNIVERHDHNALEDLAKTDIDLDKRLNSKEIIKSFKEYKELRNMEEEDAWDKANYLFERNRQQRGY